MPDTDQSKPPPATQPTGITSALIRAYYAFRKSPTPANLTELVRAAMVYQMHKFKS